MIKAIETVYNGYRFRSRLEARWAVFFDACGLEYSYEPEGFEMNGIRYLPDFWLHHILWRDDDYFREWGKWIEIKPIEATEDAIEKLTMVCAGTGHNGWLLQGEPWIDAFTVTKIQVTHVDKPEIRENICPFWGLYDPYLLKAAFISARSARFEYGEHGK